MSGYPDFKTSTNALIDLCKLGVDAIEIGVPYSDPIADGPVNQKAARIALDEGMSLLKVFKQIDFIRCRGFCTPIILFSYFNPIYNLGYENFCKKAIKSGVNSILVVDLPPDEGEIFFKLCRKYGLGIVVLVSPLTPRLRLLQYLQYKPNFIYYISRLSVTGIKSDLSEGLEDKVLMLKDQAKGIPIVVGFGLSTKEQVKKVAGIADGVVIGSALVKSMEKNNLKVFRKLAEGFYQSIKLV